MIVKLLNGKEIDIKLKKYKFDINRKSRSLFQKQVGLQLKLEFPNDIILEEVRVPVENFILDFFIPSTKIVIECQGRQHTEHVKFYHRKKKDFHEQLDRDERKRKWCEINGFKLIEINYNEFK